jgi:hypothetical protein
MDDINYFNYYLCKFVNLFKMKKKCSKCKEFRNMDYEYAVDEEKEICDYCMEKNK